MIIRNSFFGTLESSSRSHIKWFWNNFQKNAKNKWDGFIFAISNVESTEVKAVTQSFADLRHRLYTEVSTQFGEHIKQEAYVSKIITINKPEILSLELLHNFKKPIITHA